jgi:hypothetical protein
VHKFPAIGANSVKFAHAVRRYEPKEFLNTKLKGLSDLEKLLKKAGFESLIGHLVVKPPGAPTLVDENDKRELYAASQVKKDFEVLDDVEDLDLN